MLRALIYVFSLTAFPALALAQSSASPVARPMQRIAGFVADSNGAPVSAADVRLTPVKQAPISVRTDAAGHFALSAPNGPAQLNVRRLGYHQFNGTIEIGGDHADSLNITIYVASTELAAIQVVDVSPGDSLAPAEFYKRMKSNQFGRFLDRAAIEEKHAEYPSELLRGMPGVGLQRARRYGLILRIRGCRPTVWIDGVRAGGAELDDVAVLFDMAGMEVYSSQAGLPPQYVDRTNPCGAILVWTRRS